MPLTRSNPDGLFSLDAFTQVVVADAGARTVYIAGQGAFDARFQLVGEGDLYAQTQQAFRNLETAVTAVGGTVDDIASTTIYLVDLDAAKVETFSRAMAECRDGRGFPPNASTMVGVGGLAAEGMLIEISAIAVV